MFDMGGLGGMLAGFQQRIKEIQEACATTHYSGSAGGGVVEATVNGQNQLLSLNISDELLEDKELLEDLILVAVNQAIEEAKSDLKGQMDELTAGLPIPPGMLNL